MHLGIFSIMQTFFYCSSTVLRALKLKKNSLYSTQKGVLVFVRFKTKSDYISKDHYNSKSCNGDAVISVLLTVLVLLLLQSAGQVK